MIEIEEKIDLKPKCPHCKQELDKVYSQQLNSFLGKRYIYFCPQCRGVLGISHRKGFWMG
jgi:uncharacterized protein with PIN domain